MSWSTRELAELAGTSLRTVRYYHDVGLLPEPERLTNGYKAYGMTHLVRVLWIKRLADLGFPLTKIAGMDGSAESSQQALLALDTELAATMERLQQTRDEVARLLREKASIALPPELAFAPVDVEVPETERSMSVVITQLLGPSGREAFADWMRDYERTPVDRAFEALAADADDQARAELAERMLPDTIAIRARHNAQLLKGENARYGPGHVRDTIGAALRDIYNPAQLDVLARVSALLPPYEPPANGDDSS